GVAVTYVGPAFEGGLSIEQTVSGGIAGVTPAAPVYRIVMRTTRKLFCATLRRGAAPCPCRDRPACGRARGCGRRRSRAARRWWRGRSSLPSPPPGGDRRRRRSGEGG